MEGCTQEQSILSEYIAETIDATVMTVQTAFILLRLHLNHTLKKQHTQKKQIKMRPNVITKGGNADWILQTKCAPAVRAALTQTCQMLQLLSENRFFPPSPLFKHHSKALSYPLQTVMPLVMNL